MVRNAYFISQFNFTIDQSDLSLKQARLQRISQWRAMTVAIFSSKSMWPRPGSMSGKLWQTARLLVVGLLKMAAIPTTGKKRCIYGQCKVDERYPERCIGVTFYPFPKPKTKQILCEMWIKMCGRPHEDLNKNKITKNFYVCSNVCMF